MAGALLAAAFFAGAFFAGALVAAAFAGGAFLAGALVAAFAGDFRAAGAAFFAAADLATFLAPLVIALNSAPGRNAGTDVFFTRTEAPVAGLRACLLYTSDAADE